MTDRIDHSVSPANGNPSLGSLGSPNTNGSASLPQSGLRLVVSSDQVEGPPGGSPGTKAVRHHRKTTSMEAADYLNGGLPHEGHADGPENGTASAVSPGLQSALKHPGPFPFETTGTSTPPGRRSVQFVRQEPTVDFLGHVRQDSFEDAETPSKDRRGQSLMSKLKSLASSSSLQTHGRNQSNTGNSYEEGTGSAPRSPTGDRSSRFPHTLLEEEGSDADAEETADEEAAADAGRAKRKRRFRRPQDAASGSQTAPNTPKTRGLVDSPIGTGRSLGFLNRRATDGSLEQRGHLSEGEGQDRMNQSAWRRGSSWMGRSGLSLGGHEDPPDVDGAGSRRPGHFRRAMSGFGGGQSEGEGQTPRRPFLGAERATTFGAQRWRMLKHGLKLLGTKREEHKVDYMKSAELMAELRAVAPAALILASMIQRDEHGNKRIPVLLEQVKIKITDSKASIDEHDEKERHLVFRIELEYGSGLNRMKWTIHRSLRDFSNLHLRYKIRTRKDQIQLKGDENRPKQPSFPLSAFPYFRGVRGLGESEEDEADNARADGNETAEGTHSETERKRKKRRPSFTGARRKGSSAGQEPGTPGAAAAGTMLNAAQQARLFNERQRKKLETYLQEMIRWLIFRPDSNRLCRFLELSALGVRLAAEGSYHGKEGNLSIQGGHGLDLRKILTPKNVFSRHTAKWFLVRHSYIVCVDSPENMHICDVYLVDSRFELLEKHRKLSEMNSKEMLEVARTTGKHPKHQHHSLKLQNSERKVKLIGKDQKIIAQFDESIRFMLSQTPWSKPNRFGSFAPVRTGVHAQWLVDGRDYMWNVSRAINQAKDVIYIHDWWLSPQLYMRRPAAISQKWRLDRLLQRKAREGVKVFIIIYRNVEAAVPIDSEFTKFSMLDLHPNIFVQRSPNQYKKNQFFFAHHEKICVVDHSVAFVGGIDLCFGRWDTPQHSLVDDKPTGFEQSDLPKDSDHCQLWPGKDYSNPRVQDFYKLDEPYAEMYDRSKTPRMPWHDISMQVVGQPARDLTRHFIQRWNYILRGRKPTRPTPFLLPPPDYKMADLEALGLTGTCEVQILRSASEWSLGVTEVEHSIMNAYCKMIEESEHFVYMENQFFISSCETMNVKIVNKIGDAIVERATRAYNNGEAWRCVILIPLMPGFQNTVDEPEGTSVRLIMQCQFRSICRGEGSIFERLRRNGIDEPEDFVNFYSLRTWGKIGPKKMLVTEQLYIHAKAIIVDDRIALIGSANINERSMLGSRDSECAAVVRDTDMLWSTMDGQPYLVGRFAHSLRMRLMREHLGLDVDEVLSEERQAEVEKEQEDFEAKMNGVYDEDETERAQTATSEATLADQQQRADHLNRLRSFNHDADWEEALNPNIQPDKFKPLTTDKRVTNKPEHAAEVDGHGPDQLLAAEKTGVVRGRDSVLVDGGREVLVTDIAAEGKGTLNHPRHRHSVHRQAHHHHHISDESVGLGNENIPPMPTLPRRTTEQLGLSQLSQLPALPLGDDTDIGGPPVILDVSGNPTTKPYNPLTADIKPAHLDNDCMRDPLNDSFFEDTWRRIANNNTDIFRRVFRCNPDTLVTNWHEYTQYVAYAERFAQAQSGAKSTEREQQEGQGSSGPPGATVATSLAEKIIPNGRDNHHPLGTVAEWAENAEAANKSPEDAIKEQPELPSNSQIDGNDEKAAMRRASDEPLSPVLPAGDEAFPSMESTFVGSHATSEKATQPSTRKTTFSTNIPDTSSNGNGSGPTNQGSVRRRRRGTTKGSKGFSGSEDLLSKADAEELLSLVQGNIVNFPYNWLQKEEINSNWLYQVDQVAPLQI